MSIILIYHKIEVLEMMMLDFLCVNKRFFIIKDTYNEGWDVRFWRKFVYAIG